MGPLDVCSVLTAPNQTDQRRIVIAKRTVCSIDGCDNQFYCRGFCTKHYQRWRKHGDPLVEPTPSETRQFFDMAISYNGDECLFWPFALPKDGRAIAFIDGEHRRVARYVCEQVYGAPPTSAYHSAHSCGKGHLSCINPKHLRWATKKENESDKLIHGTSNRGERCGTSKLTAEDVIKIKNMLKNGMQHKDIAKMFSVNRITITSINIGKSWSWLTINQEENAYG